jgi:hypothetical protein
VNVDGALAAVIEDLGEVVLAVTGEVTSHPLLGIPEASLPCCPALHRETIAMREVDVDGALAAVIEDFGQIILLIKCSISFSILS